MLIAMPSIGSSAGTILFVQPFSLGSAGGGPRILRALLERAPFVWREYLHFAGKTDGLAK